MSEIERPPRRDPQTTHSELERLTLDRAVPAIIVSDNGTELTSGAVLRWAIDRVAWHYIQPGKPVQNAFIESFNTGCGMNASTNTCSSA